MEVLNTAARPRVLVVDDEESILETTQRAFRRKFDMVLAKSGPEAVELLGEHEFDIALVDYMMPGMNGVAVCQQAAQIQPGMRRVMVTAHVDLDDVDRALDSGIVQLVVIKPWSRAELEDAVREELARSG